MPDRRFAPWLLAGAVLVAAPAHAQVAPRFAEFLRDAEQASPRIAANEAEVDAARGLARQVGARPNPTLRAEVENFAGEPPYGGLDRAETTIAVEQPFELGGKRSSRVAAARAEVVAAEARSYQARVGFAHDLALAYAAVEAADARLLIARDAIGLAQQDARVARLLVENGKEARVRSVQANAVVASARGDLAAAEAERDGALARLNALAIPAAAFVSVVGGLLDTPAAGAAMGSEDGPSVALARAERDAARYRIDVELRRAVPDITVSLGARRLEGDDATAMVAGVSVPLPLFHRNRGAVDSASANARAADARLIDAAVQAEAERLTARSKARAADTRVTAAAEGEQAAAEAYRLAKIGYEGGKMPLIELLSARRRLVEARSRTVDARFARVQALAELARLQGMSLAGELR